MRKHEFLNRLEHALSGFSQDEVRKTLDYYTEMIDDALEDSGEEEAIIANLGSVDDIAEKLTRDTPVQQITLADFKKRHWSRVSLLCLTLGAPLWIPFLLLTAAAAFAFWLSAWAVVAALFAVTGALALSGAAYLAASPFLLATAASLKALLTFGVALTSIGTAILLFYASVFCTKQLIRFTRLLTGGIRHFFTKQGGASDDPQ